MAVQDLLSSSLGRNDQEPNRQLASRIAETEDESQLKELVSFFETTTKKSLQNDCALALAWLAGLKPGMMVPYADLLTKNLKHPVNRVVFGSMIGLSGIAHLVQDKMYQALPDILDAMDVGTVVTRDHGYRILIVLYENNKYKEDVFPLILEQLMKAPSNQLGQYTEKLMVVLESKHVKDTIRVLEERQEDIVNPHHISRLNKNLKKLYKR